MFQSGLGIDAGYRYTQAIHWVAVLDSLICIIADPFYCSFTWRAPVLEDIYVPIYLAVTWRFLTCPMGW